MCLILFAYGRHPRYRLVLAANRDEFYGRPTAAARFWDEAPDLLAGRDLKGGGTWLGVTRAGRFAAITNYREPGFHEKAAPSRGALVTDFLRGEDEPATYLETLAPTAARYNGFNLLIGDVGMQPTAALGYFSNREGHVRMLAPGLYGLSNHLLNTPWPKVERGKALLEEHLQGNNVDASSLLDALDDPAQAPDDLLPDTGVGLAWERALSPLFIRSPDYGTRASSVLLIGHDGAVTFAERTFEGGTERYEFEASGEKGRGAEGERRRGVEEKNGRNGKKASGQELTANSRAKRENQSPKRTSGPRH